MYKPTAQQKALMRSGACTRCGIFCTFRNTAGQCNTCHNLQYAEHKALNKIQAAAGWHAGRQYWQDRGIAVGETVIVCLPSMFAPAGEIVPGIAKVGSYGAYVKCMGKKCNPEIFYKIGKSTLIE